MPIAEVGTDRERLDTWSKDAAIKANRVVREFGLELKGLVEKPLIGFVASFLDGIWLRAPYPSNPASSFFSLFDSAFVSLA